MSVKPSRRAEDGAAMVGWTLLGCISDIGGLTRDAVEGVRGGRFGDDMTALRLWVTSLTGLSSRSVTDSRFAGGAAFDWDCHAPGVSGDETLETGVLLRLVCSLLTLEALASRADRRAMMAVNRMVQTR